jgi:hypothetical protein
MGVFNRVAAQGRESGFIVTGSAATTRARRMALLAGVSLAVLGPGSLISGPAAATGPGFVCSDSGLGTGDDGGLPPPPPVALRAASATRQAALMAPHGPRQFSFGAFNRDFLARGEGLSMLALEGRGTPDAAEFRTAGIGDFEPFELERQGQRRDGSLVRFAFTLAFAADPGAPQTGFFTCHNHFPENFWIAALQVHANSAASVAGVVLVAENPSDHHIFLSAFTGEREMLATSSSISIKISRGEIEVMTPAAFLDHFGTKPPDTSSGARLAALRFAVSDIDATAKLLEHAGLAHAGRMGRIILGPQAAMGATLAFEPI